MFDDPRFGTLDIKRVRLVVPWDGVWADPARIDAWLAGAQRAGATPLVAFGASSGSRCPAAPCVAPSPAQLVAAFDAFRGRYPHVTEFGAWNEANHQAEPTAFRPELAARYYMALRDRCPTCTLVGADVLDDASMGGWVRGFQRAVDREPEIWGLHNYSDVNAGVPTGTNQLLEMVGGRVWLTETGGIVRFTSADGRDMRPYDEERAARAVRYAWRMASARADRITRLYSYNWHATPTWEPFDSALVGADGAPRPAFLALGELLRPDLPPSALDAPPGTEAANIKAQAEARAKVTGKTGGGGRRKAGTTGRAGGDAPARPGTVTIARGATWRGGWVTLTVRCRGPIGCSGAISLAHVAPKRVTRLGGTVAHLQPGTTTRVTVGLSRRGRTMVRRSRFKRFRAQAEMRTTSGSVDRRRTTVRLSARGKAVR